MIYWFSTVADALADGREECNGTTTAQAKALRVRSSRNAQRQHSCIMTLRRRHLQITYELISQTRLPSAYRRAWRRTRSQRICALAQPNSTASGLNISSANRRTVNGLRWFWTRHSDVVSCRSSPRAYCAKPILAWT